MTSNVITHQEQQMTQRTEVSSATARATETIDLTPTWESLVPVLLHIAQHSESLTARQDIQKELTQMARAADKWNAHCKASA